MGAMESLVVAYSMMLLLCFFILFFMIINFKNDKAQFSKNFPDVEDYISINLIFLSNCFDLSHF